MPGDSKVRMAQQRLLGHDIPQRVYPAQRHPGGAGMRANKQLFEGGALGGGLQTEALTDIRPVFIVVGDFQPRALLVAAVLAMPLQRSTSASFSFSAAFVRRLVRVNQYSRAPGSGGRRCRFPHYTAGSFQSESGSRTVRGGRRHLRTTPGSGGQSVQSRCRRRWFCPRRCLAKPQAGQKTCTGTLSLLPFGVPTSGAYRSCGLPA